jgi:spore germination protein YaaH
VVKTAPTDYRWPSSTEVLPVSFASRRPGAAPLRRLVVVGLTAAVLASGTIVPASASAVRTPAVAPAAPAAEEALPEGLLPTIHYEDAVAHAGDRIEFSPGERVAVGFSPRAGDRWSVDGAAPRALPAGRLSGHQMRAGVEGGPAVGPTVRPEPTPAAEPTPAPEPTPVPEAIPTPEPTPPPSPVPSATPAEPTPGPIDAPAVDPSTVIEADGASFSEPTAEGEIDLAATVSPNGLRREVFGFLPYWELSDSSTTLDYTKLSTIAYFGVGAAANGNLEKTNSDGSTTVGWSGWTSNKMTSVVNAAHQGKTRVVLTIQSFAWSSGGLTKQQTLLGSATNRANLARNIVKAVTDRGADGVNLDFEPLASGYAEEFTALVRTVRAEFNKVAPGYQITFDTTGYIGNYPLEAATASGGADAIFIMGYDYRSSGSGTVGSIAPIGGPSYDITDTLIAYLKRVPASKLILGVPYYGRAWSTDTSSLNAKNISSTKYGTSAAVIYSSGIELLQEHGRKYDSREGVAWTAYKRQNCTTTYGCVTPWRQLYMDDATALKAKYDLVNRYGLRGAGIWALGYDNARPELWNAIQAKFVNDSTPPVVGITRLSTIQLSPTFTVKWTGYDESGIASYDVQVAIDGGAWTIWKSGTTATSAAFVGRDDRRYAFRVRGTDIKGNTTPWSSLALASSPGLAPGGFGMVRVDGLAMRASPSTSASQVGTVSTNNLLAITGGPVSADGYTWYQVTGPLKEWPAVAAVTSGVWVAASSSSATNVTPAGGPHQTRVGGAVAHLSFRDAGAASLGSTEIARASRKLSPNGDGIYDTLVLRWTNKQDLDSLEMRVFRADGSTLGVVPVPRLAAGARVFTWDGKVNGTRVPNGAYLLALVGTVGTATHSNPASSLATSEMLNVYGVRAADILHPYTDVSAFVRPIEWMYMEGITGGCTPTRYCPGNEVTRAQMAMFLTRALDLPSTSTDYFDDDDGKTGESSINALAKAGITGGCGPRRFCPDADVTRIQMAQFLHRALDLPSATTDYFDDDDGRTGEASVNALAKAGITGGCGPRRYCPSAPVQRGQMAAFLHRALSD